MGFGLDWSGGPILKAGPDVMARLCVPVGKPGVYARHRRDEKTPGRRAFPIPGDTGPQGVPTGVRSVPMPST